MIVSSALMIWKGLMVATGSESPIVVVLSGSMEPAFHRGDLLFLTNYEEEDIRVGEIVVFKVGETLLMTTQTFKRALKPHCLLVTVIGLRCVT